MPTHDVFWPATRNDIHWGIWSGTALIALVTLGRATAGAVAQIHPVWVSLISACVLGCNLLTWWWSLPEPVAEEFRAHIARGGIALSPSVTLGVVLAGASTAGLIGVLALVAGGLAFVVVHVQQRGITRKSATIVPSEHRFESVSPEVAETTVLAEAFDDPEVQQQIIRRRTESGGESLEALLRIEFAANQREASIHLPIQPALTGLPEVECEPLEDADVDLKVGAVHSYGVRIEAKRAGGELEAATIAVGILVRSTVAAEAAA